MDKVQLLQEQLSNMIKLLSAIFESNGNTITLDKDILTNAPTRFNVTMEEKDGKVILKKHLGKSPIYYSIFDEGKNNSN